MDRVRIVVEGIVQGVGFRPHVHGLATARGLAGFVRNDGRGVVIEVEGRPSDLDGFLHEVRGGAPDLAVIHRLRTTALAPSGETGFRIVASRVEGRDTLVSPDVATCGACLQELRDPSDRRHRYPFLNCTACGPRFTIIRDLPYDRPRTTMAAFAMCDACRAEYDDPGDRRFHAQPTACPACGPRLALRGQGGVVLDGEAALDEAAAALRAGRIVAVKGLGGYHLACDATDGEAVARLRRRKAREVKPLALMVEGAETARRLCHLSQGEEALLTSARRPIVLLRKRSDAASAVSRAVAPGHRYLGLMLPYTPLHHLLLEEVGRPLVMTSGNRTDEPIAFRDEDALGRLAGVADLFLLHDRPIEVSADDSVTRFVLGGEMPLRRSRGYAPQPLVLSRDVPVPLLAVGGHLKNTFCLARGRHAFISHHVGDLETLETYRALDEGIGHYRRLFGIEPRVVVHDLHPDYLSTRVARELADAEDLERVEVQHHHAHVAACMAEHGLEEPVIGVAFDGTGYGSDGAVWGGEFLVVRCGEFRRAGHLAYVPLPGGEAAVREPLRMALSHLDAAFGDGAEEILEELAPGRSPDGDEVRLALLRRMLRKGVASPPTSSVGRLFDAVSVILGAHEGPARYEGEPAVALEMAADPTAEDAYPVVLEDAEDGSWRWKTAEILQALVRHLRLGASRGQVAGRFHRTVAEAVVVGCGRIRRDEGLDRVVLSGGVFQNALLLEVAVSRLAETGFDVLVHRRVPPNDGGLSLGQAAVAAERIRSGTVSLVTGARDGAFVTGAGSDGRALPNDGAERSSRSSPSPLRE